MVVVAVEEGDRNREGAEDLPDEAQVFFTEGDGVGGVQAVKRVVDQVAGDGDEVGRPGADLFDGLDEEVGHLPAEALGNFGGAGEVVAQVKVGDVRDEFHVKINRIKA